MSTVGEKINDLVYLACAEVDDNGNVIKITNNGPEQILIDNKRLVVPCEYQLSGKEDPLWKERVLFNPFLESVSNTAPTPVLDWFIRSAQLRVNVSMMVIISNLLEVYASPDSHKNLTPEQMVYISKLEDIDKKTLDFYNKSIAPLGQRGDYAFVTFFPKHLGVLNDITYKRTCHVSSPMYAELTGTRKFGKSVELPKGQSAKIASVIKMILPKIDITEAYSKGSNSLVAPFAESFLGALLKVIDHVSQAQQVWPVLFKTDKRQFGMFEPLELELFGNVDSLVDEIRRIPKVNGADAPINAFASAASAPVQPLQRPAYGEAEPAPRASRYDEPERRSRFDNDSRNNRNSPRNDQGVVFTTEQLIRNQRNSCGYDDGGYGYGRYDDDDYNDKYRNNRRRNNRRDDNDGGNNGW